MAMNRPSVYGAFGDKEALYLKTLERYRDDSLAALRAALDPALPLREGLAAVYAKSIEIYLGGLNAARGCFLIGTATAEAVSRTAVRDILRGSLQAFDAVIADRLRLAMERGEISAQADPAALAVVASAIMHSLAVRARAGESRQELEALACAGVALICPNSAVRAGT
jgi:AcrR family transcriptional regulator